MRTLIKIKNSTKAERILGEELKNFHIPFKHRVKIFDRECDFLVDNWLVIEVGNHKGNSEKNAQLLSSGYSLYTVANHEVRNKINQIKKIWLEHQVKVQQT